MTPEINDAIATFEEAYQLTPTYNSETATSVFRPNNVVYSNVRKYKGRQPDYRPGPVKIYTKKEIDEYVKSNSIP